MRRSKRREVEEERDAEQNSGEERVFWKQRKPREDEKNGSGFSKIKGEKKNLGKNIKN